MSDQHKQMAPTKATATVTRAVKRKNDKKGVKATTEQGTTLTKEAARKRLLEATKMGRQAAWEMGDIR